MQSSHIEAEIVEDRHSIPLDAARWNALVQQNATNTVFQTFEWFDAWWEAFAAGHRLFFLILRKGGHIIGFAPLMITDARRLQFVGTGNADYLDFVITSDRSECISVICAVLHRNRSRWSDARFCNLPERSTTVAELRGALQDANLYGIEEAHVRCPAMRLDSEHGKRAQDLINRYSMRRALNWYRRNGTLKFRHVTTASEVERLLPVFFDQHVARWRAEGRPSQFEQPGQRRFYSHLAGAAHEAGWLLFSVVEFNGVPIAFHYGFDYARTIVWYKPSFDVSLSHHSPGLVLIRQLIEDGQTRARQELDFTIGEEPFKKRFADIERTNTYLMLYHSPVRWLVAAGVSAARRGAGRCLRAGRQVASSLAFGRSPTKAAS